MRSVLKFSPDALRRLVLAALLTPAALDCAGASAKAECTGEDGGSSLVAEIRGGDTLVLQDGRSMRLAGVLIPRRGSDTDITGQARAAAEKAISELVLGQVAELRLDARQRDRYGRLLAQLFVTRDGQRI